MVLSTRRDSSVSRRAMSTNMGPPRRSLRHCMRAARAARNLINVGAELIRRSPGHDGLDTRPLFIHVKSHKDVVQKLVNAYVKTLKYIASLSSDYLAHSPPGQG